jgi:hypothetical protein
MANEIPDSQTLFSGCFNPKLTHKGSILACLSILAETMKHEITEKAGMGYVASLNPLTRQQLVQAFSRALDESKFFPVPALLRDFASVAPSGDPVASEAREELFRIVAAMRVPQPKGHGPMLRPLPGRVLYGTEEDPRGEDGRCAAAPIRGESTPFVLARRTEAALVRLGWGCREGGIALIAESPAVAGRSTDDGQYATNRLRAGDELLAKWTNAYREAR